MKTSSHKTVLLDAHLSILWYRKRERVSSSRQRLMIQNETTTSAVAHDLTRHIFHSYFLLESAESIKSSRMYKGKNG